jgi:hypothetical protein
MVRRPRLRTREEQFCILEKTVGEIFQAKQVVEKAGTIINAVNAAHSILRGKEDHEEFKARLEALEALNGIHYTPKPAEAAGEDPEAEVQGNV